MNSDEWEIAMASALAVTAQGLGSIDGCAAAGGSWRTMSQGILGRD